MHRGKYFMQKQSKKLNIGEGKISGASRIFVLVAKSPTLEIMPIKLTSKPGCKQKELLPYI